MFFLLLVFLFLSSCHRTKDPLIGRWTVDKVNVEFNERIATPEMVRQYGEMEKGNVIEIGMDSLMTFVSGGDTLKTHCVLEGNRILRDGKLFGRYENGMIQTESSTPLGIIKVTYRK